MELTETRQVTMAPSAAIDAALGAAENVGVLRAERLSPTSVRLVQEPSDGSRRGRSSLLIAVPRSPGVAAVTIAGDLEPLVVALLWSALGATPAVTPPPTPPPQRLPPPDPRTRRPDALAPPRPDTLTPAAEVVDAPAAAPPAAAPVPLTDQAPSPRRESSPVVRSATIRLDSGIVHTIGPSGAVLGREPTPIAGGRAALVAVDDAKRLVSRNHLAVTPANGGVTVVDLGSTNGSAVVTADGDQQPLVAGAPVLLVPGMSGRFGGCSFRLLDASTDSVEGDRAASDLFT
jgi:hypothetical protein